MFNHAKIIEGESSGSVPKNPWGGHGLAPQQHWTFFPHTDDNTFLGFAVDQPLDEIRPMFDRQSSKAVLVYGKVRGGGRTEF